MLRVLLLSLFSLSLFAQDIDGSGKSGVLDPLILGSSALVSPFFPPAILLAKPPTIQNRKNVRKGGLSASAQLVQSNGKTSVGLNLEYALTRDLNHWVVKASQYGYETSNSDEVTVQKLGIEYRMIPYKGFQMGMGFGVANWKSVAASSSQETSETSSEFSFPVQWQATKQLKLYYQPSFAYFSDAKEVSGEAAGGLVFKLLDQIHLRAGFVHIFAREGAEAQTLTTVDFALAI